MKLRWVMGFQGIAIVWLLLGALTSHAQITQETQSVAPAENPAVVAVRIVAEDGKVLAESSNVVTVEIGKPLDRDKVAESLRALYRTGNYSDLRAVTTPVEGGIRLDFVTRESI